MIPKRNCYLLVKNIILITIFCSLLFLFIRHYFIDSFSKQNENKEPSKIELIKDNASGVTEIQKSFLRENLKNTNNLVVLDKVHVFYYPWYGNPEDDSVYLHWNHKYIPNWDKQDPKVYPSGQHQPPDDIGANFYPFLGCYSSRNTATVAQHMKWIHQAGIGVLVISWYPPELSDKEGKPFDELFPLFLDSASIYNLKISFHIEPYEGRTPKTLRKDIEYILHKYGNHPALYKMSKFPSRKPLPVFYVYDSYLSAPSSWSSLLSLNGEESIRNSDIDGIFLGLVVELRHK